MARRRLDAWKEIAAYLGRDVTTVRRWERREGLPVYRHVHDKLGSVYAYADEIDEWMSRRSTTAGESDVPSPLPPPEENERRPPVAVLWRMAAGLAALVAVAFAATSMPWRPRPTVVGPPILPVAISAPQGTSVDTLVWSPDAAQVLFSASDSGGTRLWLRRTEALVAEPLPATEGALFPFWSPDGQRIGFFADARLKLFTLATREVRDLTSAPEGHGGAWNERDEILFAPDRGAALMRILASGGPVTRITTLGHSFKEGHAWPSFLPDGRHFLYTDYTADQKRFGIWVGDLDSGATKRIVREYSSGAYAPDGFLLYVKDSLMAQRFDLARLEVAGEPTPVANHVVLDYDLGFRSDFSVSRAGYVAARTVDRQLYKLQWIDRSTGRQVEAVGARPWISNPTLSPDGKHLLATITNEEANVDNLWSFDVDTGQGTRMSFGSGSDFSPVWSANGADVVYSTGRKLYRLPFGSGRAPEPVFPAPFFQAPESWSRDGRYLVISTMANPTKYDVWLWEFGDGEPRIRPLLKSSANEGQARISPDGRFLAYASDKSGRFEVYVRTFPDGGEEWQVSSAGGADPKWKGHGGELFYVAADRRMMAVDVSTDPTFRVRRTNRLFQTEFDSIWFDTRNHYDVTPDGQRFVMIAPVTDRRQAPFALLVNWADRLKR